jgi:sodium-dependent dicarboxylate transporter 2/3/5
VVKALKIITGPLLGIISFLLLQQHHTFVLAATGGIAILMAYWWITESISLYFTALLPVILFPFFGVMGISETAPLYMSQVIFLFIGGFLMSFALEKWNLHKRIALFLILKIGNSPSRLLFGFMFVSYFLSMWILNTATVLMLFPAVLAVIQKIQENDTKADDSLVKAYLLGIAFASSIGGTATMIGTAPNMVFMDFYSRHLQDFEPITFTQWMAFGVPLSFVFLLIAFLVLKRLFVPKNIGNVDVSSCKIEYIGLGKMGYEEKAVGFVFGITILAWLFLNDINLGSFTIKGWSNLLPEKSFVKESSVSLFAVMLLFLIPSKTEKGNFLLNWDEAKKLPLGIILLFGGGFALAKAADVSGLSDLLAQQLSFVSNIHPILIIIVLATFMTFFTELTSNTASTLLMLPIVFAIAQNTNYHPLLFLLPITFSASFAFMLPVATPPNTIIFGSEKIRVQDMVRAGIWLNLFGIILISIMLVTLGQLVFDIKM